jgi:hypothetical protein
MELDELKLCLSTNLYTSQHFSDILFNAKKDLDTLLSRRQSGLFILFEHGHFSTVLVKGQTITFADSLADEGALAQLQQVTAHWNRHLSFLPYPLQSSTSKQCGCYALVFSYYLCQGLSLKDIVASLKLQFLSEPNQKSAANCFKVRDLAFKICFPSLSC